MTDSKGLTIQEITSATENGNKFFAQMAKQLLATMQREVRLMEAAILVINSYVPVEDKARAADKLRRMIASEYSETAQGGSLHKTKE